MPAAVGRLGQNRTAEHYRTYFTSPVVKIDRSDIDWAIAYAYFAEAIIYLALSYDVAYDIQNPSSFKLLLSDRERIRTTVYERLLAGVRHLKAVRKALLSETDDRLEWIPNPKQKKTSFPLVMDEQTFDTWGKLLEYVDELLAGKVLLGGRVSHAERPVLQDLTFGICDENEGLNLKDLFDRPIKDPLDSREWKSRCRRANNGLRFSGIRNLLAEVIARNRDGPERQSGEWTIVRYLYWVN